MKYNRILFLIFTMVVLVTSKTITAQENEHFTIGYLLWFSSGAFIEEMEALGYVEGENVTYLKPDFGDFASLTPAQIVLRAFAEARRIVAENPDVIIASSDVDANNIRAMTPDIPIVFAYSDDPVATGAVEDLINPGGLTTGIVTNRPHERRLQILTEMKPDTDKVYYLYNTQPGDAETILEQVSIVADELGVEIIPAPLTNVESAMEVIADVPDGVDWIFLTSQVPVDLDFYRTLGDISLERQIGVTGVTDTPIPGFLMGYGPNLDDRDIQAVAIVDRVLRGAAPADLPIQIADNFLMINVEQAEAIHLEIPIRVLRQADIIIRPGYFDEFPFYDN